MYINTSAIFFITTVAQWSLKCFKNTLFSFYKEYYTFKRGGEGGSTFHMAEFSFFIFIFLSSLTFACAHLVIDYPTLFITNTLPSLISIIAHHRCDQRSHHLLIHHSGLLKFFFTIRVQFFRLLFFLSRLLSLPELIRFRY